MKELLLVFYLLNLSLPIVHLLHFRSFVCLFVESLFSHTLSSPATCACQVIFMLQLRHERLVAFHGAGEKSGSSKSMAPGAGGSGGGGGRGAGTSSKGEEASTTSLSASAGPRAADDGSGPPATVVATGCCAISRRGGGAR